LLNRKKIKTALQWIIVSLTSMGIYEL
jgi:hypothetical protein